MQQDRISISSLANTSWHVPIPNTQATRLPPDHFPETGRVATPTGEMTLGQLSPHTPILTSEGFVIPKIKHIDAGTLWEMMLVPCGALERNWPIADVLLSPDQSLCLRTSSDPEKGRALIATSEELLDTITSKIRIVEASGPLVKIMLPKPAVFYMSGLPILIGKDCSDV